MSISVRAHTREAVVVALVVGRFVCAARYHRFIATRFDYFGQSFRRRATAGLPIFGPFWLEVDVIVGIF